VWHDVGVEDVVVGRVVVACSGVWRGVEISHWEAGKGWAG